MIAPLENIELLTERPPLSLGVFYRFLRPFRSMMRRFDQRNDDALNQELSALLSDVSLCESRDDLEALLGRPNYAMVGSAFGTSSREGVTTHPDLVECYTRGRLCVDLWFRDGRLDQHMGYLMPTAWDVLFAD